MKVLFISDPHLPYTRMDLWKELHTFNKTYKADKVLCAGDFFDFYALSTYAKNPKGDTSHWELLKCMPQIEQIGKWFPRMEILPGNHDDRLKKRAHEANIADIYFGAAGPLANVIKYLHAPRAWRWTKTDRVVYDKINFVHGWFSAPRKHAEFFNESCAHGHLHAKPGIEFIGRDGRVIHNTCIGFMGDKNSLALQYGPIKYSTGVEAFGYFTNGKPFVEAF